MESFDTSLKRIDIKEIEQFINKVESAKYSNILISLENVKYVDIYAFCIFATWIISKNVNGMKIQIISPTNGPNKIYNETALRVESFMYSFQLLNYLRSRGIDIKLSEYDKEYKDYMPKKCMRLKEFNRESFNNIINQLNLESSLLKYSVENTGIKNTNLAGIKSIIIRELGKNAYEHGTIKNKNTNDAKIAIGLIPKISTDIADKILLYRQAQSPKFLRRFLKKLGNSECLQIVISDTGPGIVKTLRKAYDADDVIDNTNKSNSAIIKYAFELHSTSKQKTNLEEADSKLEWNNYIPPRGLYFVKNLAKKCRGAVICRSDRNYICYDYYSNDVGTYKTSNESRTLKSIREIPGVHLEILIPLKELREAETTQINENILKYSQNKIDDVKFYTPYTSKINRSAIFYVNDLYQFTKSCKKTDIIYIDFHKVEWDKDMLYPFLMQIYFLGLDNYKIIGINYEHHDTILPLNEIEEWDGIDKRYTIRPFISINRKEYNYDIKVIGDYSDKSNCTETVIKAINKEYIDIKTIPEYWDNIFVKRKNKTIGLSFSFETALNAIIEREKKSLISAINNVDNGIRHDGKFLFPTNAFSNVFFEIGSLFRKHELKNQLIRVVANEIKIPKNKPTCILSISSIGDQIGSSLYSFIKNKNPNITHINSSTPEIDKLLLYKLGSYDSIIILVDVIATSKSIKKVIQQLEMRNISDRITKIHSIIDLRKTTDSIQYSNNNQPIETQCIYHNATELFKESKPYQWHWSEINKINESWSPITKSTEAETFISPEEFVNQLFEYNIPVAMGHYISEKNKNHFPYCFNIDKICKTFGGIVTYKLAHIIESYLNDETDKISHVFHNIETKDITLLTDTISDEFGCEVHKIKDDGTPLNPNHFENIKTILIIDSTISSGETIWNILHSCSYLEPDKCLIYVILDRSKIKDTIKFCNLKQYNKTQIEFFEYANIPIPQYKHNTCPLCIKNKIIKSLIDSNELRALNDTLMNCIEKNKKIPSEKNRTDKLKPSKTIHAPIETLTCRIHLQKSLQDDMHSTEFIIQIINNFSSNQTLFKTLLSVLYFEIFSFSEYLNNLDKDTKHNLCKNCIEVMHNNWKNSHAIAILIHTDSKYFIDNFEEILHITIKNTTTLECMAELLINKETIGHDNLSKCVQFISKQVTLLSDDDELKFNYLNILNAVNQVSRIYAIKNHDDFTRPELIALKDIWNILFSKKIGRSNHSDISFKWTNSLAALSYANHKKLLLKHYHHESNLNENFNTIYNALKSYPELFSPLLEQHGYFDQSFLEDLDTLDSTINYLLISKDVTKEHFIETWENESTDAIRDRINNHITQDKSILKKFIKSLFSDIYEITSDFIHSKQSEHRINYSNKEIHTNSLKAFVDEETFRSLLDNFHSTLLNVIKKLKPCTDLSVQFVIKSNAKYIYMHYIDDGPGFENEPQTTNYSHRIQQLIDKYCARLKCQRIKNKTIVTILFYKAESIL